MFRRVRAQNCMGEVPVRSGNQRSQVLDGNGFATTTPAGDRVVMLHSELLFSIPIFTGLFVAPIAYGGSVVETHQDTLLSHLSLLDNTAAPASIEHAALSNSVA
jgi:hypothetical protein